MSIALQLPAVRVEQLPATSTGRVPARPGRWRQRVAVGAAVGLEDPARRAHRVLTGNRTYRGAAGNRRALFIAVARWRLARLAMNSTPEANRQCADAVLMIRPARFGANPETADSNRFQRDEPAPGCAPPSGANSMAWSSACEAGVAVGRRQSGTCETRRLLPEQLDQFPRRRQRRAVSMMAPSRRAERRAEPVAQLRAAGSASRARST